LGHLEYITSPCLSACKYNPPKTLLIVTSHCWLSAVRFSAPQGRGGSRHPAAQQSTHHWETCLGGGRRRLLRGFRALRSAQLAGSMQGAAGDVVLSKEGDTKTGGV